jgi:Na+/pantothenate symporter
MLDGPAANSLLLGAVGTSTAALITFIAYSAVILLLAVFSSRLLAGRKFLNEYFLGSRGLGVVAFTLTLGATSASAGSFAGFPALIYAHGWILGLWIASYMITPLCAMGLLGKRMGQIARQTGSITIPDVLRARFASPALALTSTLIIAVLLTVYLVPQFKLAGIILKHLLSGSVWLDNAALWLRSLDIGIPAGVEPDYLICLFMFSVMVVAYTAVGGFRAVVWTDVLQGFVMVVGVVIMLAVALFDVGGLGRATQRLNDMTPPRLAMATFTAESAVEREEKISAYTCFLAKDADGVERICRTNQRVDIPIGQKQSNTVKVVIVLDEADAATLRERIRPLSETTKLTPLLSDEQEYAYGAGKRGVYVSGPGPKKDNALGFMTLGSALSFFFFWALSGTGQPGTMVRLMAYDSVKTLKRGIASLSIYFALIYFPLVVIFCCARTIEPGIDHEPDHIMPLMAFSLSDLAGVPWLAGLLVAAPFAAAMSTVDSFMLIISSSLVRDVYQRNINPAAREKTLKRLSYGCTLLVGLAVMIAAVNPTEFMQDLIVFASGGLAVAFLIPIAMALYWPRVNKFGALASMLGGLACYLPFFVVGYIKHEKFRPIKLSETFDFDPVIWGVVASLLIGVAVTLLTPPPPQHLVRKFFYKD